MKDNKKHYAINAADHTANLQNIETQPKTTFELVNKYGTYEIQPTSTSENQYPEIAQGLAKDSNPKK